MTRVGVSSLPKVLPLVSGRKNVAVTKYTPVHAAKTTSGFEKQRDTPLERPCIMR